MAQGYPIIQGAPPQDGSIIEFAGRKYFNKPSDGPHTSGSSSESWESENDSERKARLSRQIKAKDQIINDKNKEFSSSLSDGKRRKRRPKSRITHKSKSMAENEINDAFAFLDCKRNSFEESSASEEESFSNDSSCMNEVMSRMPEVDASGRAKNRRKKKRKRSSKAAPVRNEIPPEAQDLIDNEMFDGSHELPDHRVVRSMGRDSNWVDENDIDEDTTQRAGYYKPIVSPFRQMLEAMLRPDEDPHDPRCWGCDNQEDGDYAVVEKQWNTLMNMFEKRLHKMHPAHLGVFMYRFFADRTAVKMTQAGQMDAKAQLVNKGKNEQGKVVYQFDYSVWSAYSMFRHFTEHHLNPKTQITMDLWKLMFAKIQLEADGFYRRHIASGRVVVDKESVQTYKLLNQQIYQLYRMKPEQMLFFNPNSAIDNQGYAYINSDRPIIHTHGGSDIFRMNYDTTN